MWHFMQWHFMQDYRLLHKWNTWLCANDQCEQHREEFYHTDLECLGHSFNQLNNVQIPICYCVWQYISVVLDVLILKPSAVSLFPQKFQNNETLLHCAAMKGHNREFKFLTVKKHWPNITEHNYSDTALHCAVGLSIRKLYVALMKQVEIHT